MDKIIRLCCDFREYVNSLTIPRDDYNGIMAYIQDIQNAAEQQWISVKERMPEERDSIFKERYGTDRWRDTMFLKTSDNVLATVVDDNGNYTVVPACTIDGRWSVWKSLHCKVIAWQQYPEPCQEEQDG